MADDVVNVEDDGPAIEPASPPAVPPVAAAPAEPPPDPPAEPDELEAVDLPGGKYVPLTALKTVREANRALKAQAADADTVRQQLHQLQGQVAGYRQVAEQLRQPQAPQAPQQDPRALAFAQKLDLYTTDSNGQAVPDVAKAASILGIVQEVAGQIADSRVLPMAQQTARERSIAHYNWALTVKDPNGKALPREIINEVWKSMPIEATANPDIAKTLVYTAMGMERMNQQATTPAPATLPVVTEAIGGTPRTRQPMSALETKVAAERGIDPAKWQESVKGFQSGRTQTLEE